MAPTTNIQQDGPNPSSASAIVGPHPSFIQVAKPYLFQQQLQGQLVAIGTNPTREDAIRLQGVQYINEVRTALQLPVRTFCTATVYYHKYRLVSNSDTYNYMEASAAALFTACKIEDTLKKSKEILCAAHNLQVTPAEHLSSDDSKFENPSKSVTGLERLMLEASGFDFRCRYPQKHLIKLLKYLKLDKDVMRVAYNIMIDLYRTLAPLKQSSSTMAWACTELAVLVTGKQADHIRGDKRRYRKWSTDRAQVIETILDLLDLYTHFQRSTIVGPAHHIDKFIQIRIKINQELETDSHLTRYTHQHDGYKQNGRLAINTPKTPITPASPTDVRNNGSGTSPGTLSPRSGSSAGRRAAIERAHGTVRFMLDANQAKREKETTAEYFKVEYEEYEIEVEEPIRQERDDRGPRGNHHHYQRNGRDDRFNNRGGRGRRY